MRGIQRLWDFDTTSLPHGGEGGGSQDSGSKTRGCDFCLNKQAKNKTHSPQGDRGSAKNTDVTSEEPS